VQDVGLRGLDPGTKRALLAVGFAPASSAPDAAVCALQPVDHFSEGQADETRPHGRFRDMEAHTSRYTGRVHFSTDNTQAAKEGWKERERSKWRDT